MEKIKPFQVDRPWGNFRQFNLNTPVTVKIHTIKAGAQLSLQSHTKRAEFFRVIKGTGIIQIEDKKHDVVEGDEYDILVGAKHRLIGGTDGIIILEIDTGEFDESDIIRYEDKYGRA